MVSYTSLEPSSLDSLGIKSPSFDGATSFLETTTFVYMLFFSVIVVAAFYRYVVAGALRMQSSQSSIQKSNEIIKAVTFGLLGVFSLFLILFTVNKQLVAGDVELGAFNQGGGSSVGRVSPPVAASPPAGAAGAPGGSGGSSRACEPVDIVKTKINSPGGICGGAVCTALSGCNYEKYRSVIQQETGGDSQLEKMIIVAMCKEARGNPAATHKNNDASYDCGLMQINQKGECPSSSILSSSEYIQANIRDGVRLMRQKISVSSQTYPILKVRPESGAFSSYNCCSNGTIPNSPSVSCAQKDGWPLIPKWACPIDPGDSSSNMCSVKSYVCDLTACLDKL